MGLAILSLCRMRHTDDIFSRSNDTPDTALGTRQDCKEHGHGPAHRAFMWWTLSKQVLGTQAGEATCQGQLWLVKGLGLLT